MKKLIDKIKEYLADKKKRHLVTAIVIVPFLVVIVICGINIIKEAKILLGLVDANSVVIVESSHVIENENIVLRDNCTDIQSEYFKELKKMYDDSQTTASPNDFAVSTIKNFVADYFTWSNKQGQYDVGGMYYIYAPQRATVYTKSRDGFYKFINEYMNDYGVESLLEVENVEASIDGSEFEYDIDDMEFNAYRVNANWTYVSKTNGFSSSSYQTKACFVVINNDGRYEIVYMGDKPYDESMDIVEEDIEENINEEESE